MSVFQFKHFSVNQSQCAMKIGTDSMVMGAWIQTPFTPTSILDIGTGTGVLALMMAQRYPDATVTALEIDDEAVVQAQSNFNDNEIGKNCHAVHHDFLNFSTTKRFDLIVTNPPFFENAFQSGVANRDTARHSTNLPLDELFKRAAEFLTDEGMFVIILPTETMNKYVNLNPHLHVYKQLQVFSKANYWNRTITMFAKTHMESSVEKIILRDENGDYSNAYKALTFDFHGVVL